MLLRLRAHPIFAVVQIFEVFLKTLFGRLVICVNTRLSHRNPFITVRKLERREVPAASLCLFQSRLIIIVLMNISWVLLKKK